MAIGRGARENGGLVEPVVQAAPAREHGGAAFHGIGHVALDLGHGVIEAGSGEQALRELQEATDFDVVITDFSMPRMNGLALLGELRRHYPHLPTLLISGASAPEVTADDRQAPLFLQKPFTPTALLAATRTALAHQT